MPTMIYTTSSNRAKVDDEDSVRDFLNSFDGSFDVEPAVEDGRICFSGDAGFEVWKNGDNITEEFLHRLQDHLEQTLVIRTLEVRGPEYLNDAYQRVVTSSEVRTEILNGPGEIPFDND